MLTFALHLQPSLTEQGPPGVPSIGPYPQVQAIPIPTLFP